jgi:hypothetical protein
MRHALAQLKADSADAVNHTGFALTYGGMALCGLFIVTGIAAKGLWAWLAAKTKRQPYQHVRHIVRDPLRRTREAGF